MKHSIVIPFHKDQNMLRYCLKRIRETISTNLDLEIIIVGNNVNVVELNFSIDDPDCRVYRFPNNIQYPRAVNFGVEQCSGEIVTIMDPDVFVWEGWYQALLNCMEQHPTAGAVGAKLLDPRTNRIIDFGIMYTRFNAAHTMMGLLYDHPLTQSDRKVQAVCSAIIMTKKSLFLEVGGMDEEIPYSYTDCDYCLKLRDIGYETWVAANAISYHKGSTDPNNSKSAFNYYRLDAKGIYGMKDYAKLIYDTEDWYRTAAEYAKKNYSFLPKSYVLIDLSTMYDRTAYYDMFAKLLGVIYLDKAEVPMKVRDCESITLYETLSFNYIDLATPILYFVDTFIGLFHNKLWFELRNIQYDLVIDRHGNIIPLRLIAEHCC